MWALDGTVSTSITTITIEGTVSFINAELAKLPKILNHNLLLNIVDGDYSTESITISSFIINGILTLRALTTTATKYSVKPVKISHVIIEYTIADRINIQRLEFKRNTGNQLQIGLFVQSELNISLCDFFSDNIVLVSSKLWNNCAKQ